MTDESTVKIEGKNLLNANRTLGTPSNTAWGNSNKRLFDFDEYSVGITRNNYYSGAAATTVVVDGDAYTITSLQGGYGVGFPIELSPNTTYTLSAKLSAIEYSQMSVGYYRADGTFDSYINPSNTDILTFTTPENTSFAVIVLGTVTGQTCTYYDIQLELGSTATTYEPYQGEDYTIDLDSIELAKIGTYQDRIYKTDGKWYIEKQTGKVVLDGSEDWYYATSSGGYFQLDNSYGSLPFDGNPATNALCDHFICRPRWHVASSTNYNLSINMSGSLTAIRYDAITDLADFKTWLSTHNTTVYYALATPTTTEITNQTIINQLEAVLNMQLALSNHVLGFYGTGAPGSLAVKVLHDTYEKYIYVQDLNDYLEM